MSVLLRLSPVACLSVDPCSSAVPFDGAELGDQLLRGLGPRCRGRRDVVAGVPHQREDIDHLIDAFDLPMV